MVDPKNNGVQSNELTLRSGLAVAGSALSYFTTIGFLNAFGIFQEFYASNILSDESDFQISWLGSFAIFMLFVCAPVAGILADKFGPTIPIVFGCVAQLIAIFMISLCKKYYQFFLAQGILLGVGMSFVSIPTSGIVPRYFVRNRAFAIGLSVSGSSLGGVIWPIVVNQLLHHDGTSFPWTMRIVGFIMLPLLIIVVAAVRRPVESNQSHNENGIADVNTPTEKHKEKVDRSAILKPPFILLACGLFLVYFGFFAPYFFITAYATSLGFTPSLSFYFASILNASSLFGRVVPGFFADRWGRFNVLFACSLFAGIIAFTWTSATNVGGLVVWALAYGFASGGILSLQMACCTSLVPSAAAGAAVGALTGSTSLAALFGSPIAGELVKRGYTALACFAGATLLGGSVLLWCSRAWQDRKILAKV